MRGGRPGTGAQPRRPWIEELAGWLESHLSATAQSRRAFAMRGGFDYKVIHRLANAERLPSEHQMRLIVFAFKQPWESILPMWRRAIDGEQRAHAEKLKRKLSPPDSWDEIALLTQELDDLMDAQREATESLPYRLLGVQQPKLSEIYVRQKIREDDSQVTGERPEGYSDREQPSPKKDYEHGRHTVSVSEALDAHTHLLITGDPGAGKSTLGNMYVQQLARCWLREDGSEPPVREPLLPIRVPARALASRNAWSELLASGVEEALSRLLQARPRPELFQDRALGARWLVFIDGLDEILDLELRDQVIMAISRQLRRSTEHRIIITSRPLPDGQLSSLRGPGLGEYALKPFGSEEMQNFSDAWFRAQDPITAPERAIDFLRQVRDSRIRDIVTSPLLATISAIVYTKEPHRPLPSNRVGLYERFMSYLMYDTASGRAQSAVDLLNNDRGGRSNFNQWLRRNRVKLVSHLAVHRLDDDEPLHEIACAWVRNQWDQSVALPESWENEIRESLLQLGLFVRHQNAIRFLHHSFAEFLAAKHHAEAIPTEFPALGDWLKKADEKAKQQFVLFTIVLWSRNRENNIDGVISQLLRGDGRRVVLAGRLLAEGAMVSDANAAEVADRLLNLVIGYRGSASSSNTLRREASNCLDGWVNSEITQSVVRRLREAVAQTEVPIYVRVLCASALSKLGVWADGVAALLELATEACGKAIDEIFKALSELSPSDLGKAETIFAKRLSKSTSSALAGAVIDALLNQDRFVAAREMIKELYDSRTAKPPEDLEESWWLRADSCAQFATWAAKAGLVEEGLWAAECTISNVAADEDDIGHAIESAIKLDRAKAEPLIARAMERSPSHLTELVEVLQDGGFEDSARVALELVINAGPTIATWKLTSCIGKSLQSSRPDIASITSSIVSRDDYPVRHVAGLAKVFSDKGYLREAAILARNVMADRTGDHFDYRAVLNVMLKATDGRFVQEMPDVVSGLDGTIVCVAAGLCCDHGDIDAAERLALALANHGMRIARNGLFSVDDLCDVVNRLLGLGRCDTANRVMDALVKWNFQGAWEPAAIAATLFRLGRMDEVESIASRIFIDRPADHILDRIIAGWFEHIGGSAADFLRLARRGSLSHEGVLAIGDRLANRGLLKDACEAWLEVLTAETATPEDSFGAASRLVFSGRFNEGVEVLESKLCAESAVEASFAQHKKAILAWMRAHKSTLESKRPVRWPPGVG